MAKGWILRANVERKRFSEITLRFSHKVKVNGPLHSEHKKILIFFEVQKDTNGIVQNE